MIDYLLEKINDENFKDIVEMRLREFINGVSNIKTDSNYRVIFSVQIVNLKTGSIMNIERS